MNDRNPDRTASLSKKFDEYVLGGIPRLRRLGYNPFQFLEMVERYRGAVGATKHLLADPRHTSYGFQRLLELGRLEDTRRVCSLPAMVHRAVLAQRAQRGESPPDRPRVSDRCKARRGCSLTP